MVNFNIYSILMFYWQQMIDVTLITTELYDWSHITPVIMIFKTDIFLKINILNTCQTYSNHGNTMERVSLSMHT